MQTIKEKMIPAFRDANGGLFQAVEKADVGSAYQDLEKQGVALMGWADPFMPDRSLPEPVAAAWLDAVRAESAPHYTAPIGDPALKAALAKKLKQQNGLTVDPERNILITPGSDSGLYFAILPFVGQGDEVLIPSPSYPNNFLDVKIMGGVPVAVELDQQAEMIVEWMPEAKKVGLLYCSAEANSQYQVDEVQKYLEEKGVTVTQYAFSDSNDLSSVCQKAADENDALYVPTDNTVAANTGIVDGICRPAKKPVFAGEEGICAGCGVATLSISYYDLGYTTGEMAVKILNGEADISTMPIEYTDVTKKYNKTICDDLGLTVPDGYEEIEG